MEEVAGSKETGTERVMTIYLGCGMIIKPVFLLK
jgi:hypothetical protein